MSFNTLMKDLARRVPFTVESVPATYGAGAANIFAITGGLVQILGIVERNVTVMTNATTTTISVGAVGMDIVGVPVSIAGVLGSLVVSPMDVLVAKIAAALAVQMPSLLGFATNIGVVASPGVNITVTFGGVAMAAGETYQLVVLYRKLNPSSLIA